VQSFFPQLLASPPGVYSWAFSVLSEEIILLLRLSGPALELCLCRLSDIDDREKASLEIVRILSLPVLTAGTGTGVATAVAVPWEKWGTNKADILEHDSLMGGSHFGERRAIVLPRCITIRDYNPFRVQRVLKLFGGAEREVTLECGSVVKVVKESLMYRGGEFFCDNIETILSYVKTVVPNNGCDEILMDKDNLVVVQRKISQVSHMYMHMLLD
jgi:hypothetical protein